MELSIVIPAFNEEATLAGHLDELIRVLSLNQLREWEIIVFDDGSTDATFEVVGKYGHPQVRLMRHTPNRGKGAAVRAGVLASRGEAVLVCDADMATPPAMLLPFLEELRQGADMVIGNRNDPCSSITIRQPPLRRLMGKGCIWLARQITATRLSDYNCGFKLFRGDLARNLFAQTITNGWAYDIEVLNLASRQGCKVVELPVEWRHGDDSCVRLPFDIFRTLGEMVRIWLRLRVRG